MTESERVSQYLRWKLMSGTPLRSIAATADISRTVLNRLKNGKYPSDVTKTAKKLRESDALGWAEFEGQTRIPGLLSPAKRTARRQRSLPRSHRPGPIDAPGVVLSIEMYASPDGTKVPRRGARPYGRTFMYIALPKGK